MISSFTLYRDIILKHDRLSIQWLKMECYNNNNNIDFKTMIEIGNTNY